MNKDKNLKDINNDLIFFFLVIITSFIGFYIVINKKRQILNLNCISNEALNKLFKSKIYLTLIVNIYFVINAYNSLEEIKKRKGVESQEYKDQIVVMSANTLILIASFMYLTISNSDYVISR